MIFEYGNISVDTASLPQPSLDAMIRRGLTHYFGNEQAAKVSNRKAKLASGDSPREASDDEVSQWVNELRAAALEALNAGTVGQHVTRGPAVSPEEAEARKIAKAEIVVILKANNLKVPTGEKTVKAPDGEFTMDQLIDRRLSHGTHGDRIRADAAKEVRRKAKEASKVLAGGTDL